MKRFTRSAPFRIASGLAIGQSVVFLATPLLTRLFGPTQFGELTLFVTIATIAAVLGTLRLEMLIPGATDEDAPALAVASLVSVAVVALLVGTVGLAVFRPSVETSVLLSVVIVAMGASAVLMQIAARTQQYGQLAISKAALGLVQVGVQAATGLARTTSAGLLWGVVAGYWVSVFIQYRGLRGIPTVQSMRAHRFDRARQARLIRQAVPLIFSSVANVISTSALVIATSAYAGAEATGQLGVAQRLALIPAGLAAAAIGPVIAGAVAHAVRNEVDDAPIIRRWMLRLLPLSGVAGVVLLASWFLPTAVLFGQEWEQLAFYLVALAPAVVMQILAGPLTQVLIVRGRVGLQLGWELSRLTLVAVTLLICTWLSVPALVFVATGSVALGLGYMAQVILVLRCRTRAREN